MSVIGKVGIKCQRPEEGAVNSGRGKKEKDFPEERTFEVVLEGRRESFA